MEFDDFREIFEPPEFDLFKNYLFLSIISYISFNFSFSDSLDDSITFFLLGTDYSI
jgi:hypothetical protein